jgi:hypothetical protein
MYRYLVAVAALLIALILGSERLWAADMENVADYAVWGGLYIAYR